MNIFSIKNSTIKHVSNEDFKKYFKSNNINNNYENIINHLTNILMSNKSQILLKQIYNIQSMDDFDIEGLVKLKLPTFALNETNALNFKLENIINDVNNDGIDKTLTFDASGIDSSGTWKLMLYDRTPGVEGSLDNWSITFPAN